MFATAGKRTTSPLDAAKEPSRDWLFKAQSRSKTMDQLSYSNPGEILPQAHSTTTMDRSVVRPFPQAIVTPNTDVLDRRVLFPRMTAKHGVGHMESVAPDQTPLYDQMPALKAAADAPSATKDALKYFGIAAIVVLVVVVAIQYAS